MAKSKEKRAGYIDAILKSYQDIGGINHIDGDYLPSRNSVNLILERLKDILFPGYFDPTHLDINNIAHITNNKVRLTVDEPEDFKVIKYLINKLGFDAGWRDYTNEYLKSNYISSLNRDIERNEGLKKSIKNDI